MNDIPQWVKTVALIVFIAACVVGAARILTDPASNGDAPANVQEPPLRVTAVVMAELYRENEIAADGRLRGKKLMVTGEIARIADVLGTASVDLKGTGGIIVSCSFDDDERPAIARLKAGEVVTLTGTGDGMTGSYLVGLTDCHVD